MGSDTAGYGAVVPGVNSVLEVVVLKLVYSKSGCEFVF